MTLPSQRIPRTSSQPPREFFMHACAAQKSLYASPYPPKILAIIYISFHKFSPSELNEPIHTLAGSYMLLCPLPGKCPCAEKCALSKSNTLTVTPNLAYNA